MARVPAACAGWCSATARSTSCVKAEIARLGVGDRVEAPGFVPTAQVEQALARALCLVLPSRREGYGLVVVEASSLGTPSVLVRDPDNAATELIEEGVNGFVVDDASPRRSPAGDRAGAARRAGAAGLDGGVVRPQRPRLSLEGSLDAVARELRGQRSLVGRARSAPRSAPT